MIISWTMRARLDLSEIKSYYFKKIPNAVLEEIISEVEEAGETIKKFPSIGKILEETDKRKFVLSRFNYILLYKVKDNIIFILRVVDTRNNK